jgi:hypothetical protein
MNAVIVCVKLGIISLSFYVANCDELVEAAAVV